MSFSSILFGFWIGDFVMDGERVWVSMKSEGANPNECLECDCVNVRDELGWFFFLLFLFPVWENGFRSIQMGKKMVLHCKWTANTIVCM